MSKRTPQTLAEIRQRAPLNEVNEIEGYLADAEIFARSWFKDAYDTFDVSTTLVLTEYHTRAYRNTSPDAPGVIMWIILKEPECIKWPDVPISGGKRYLVTYEGTSGYMSPDGYEKYRERLIMRDNGNLAPDEPVYGMEQALDHIRQLKRRGNFPPATKFYVEIIIETTIKIPVE